MSGNCYRVYWRVDEVGSHDHFFEDSESLTTLTWDLYNGGYVFIRDAKTNPNRDQEVQQDVFHFTIIPGREYEIISIGLNYDGGFSTPMISGKFTSKEMSLGDYESPLELTFPSVNKVSVSANYFIPESQLATADDHRMLYHRIIEVGDSLYEPLYEKGEDYMQEWISSYNPGMYGSCDFYNANVWPVRNNDSQLGSEYNHRWTWAAMTPGTNYRYLYVTEDKDGVISNLKVKEFSTANNDGGLNPSLDITVDEESFLIDELNPSFYGFSSMFTPNEDMTSFTYLYLSENVIESWGYDVDSKEGVEQGIYDLLLAQGLQSIESTKIGNTPGAHEIGKEDVVYVAGFGYGASGIESKLSYIKVITEGGKLKSLESMVQIDLPKENRAAASGIRIPYAPQSVKDLSTKANSAEVPALELNKPLKCIGEEAPAVIEASEDATVEQPVSIKEFTRKVVTRQF